MPKKPVSRRVFISTASAVPAAAAATRQPVVVNPVLLSDARVQQDPLRIGTTYKF